MRHPDEIVRELKRALALVAAGRYEEALDALSRIGEGSLPGELAAQRKLALATCLWRTGRPDEALQLWGSLDAHPDPTVRAQAWLGLGNVYDDLGRMPEATRAFAALAAVAEDLHDDRLKARSLNGLGLMAFREGEYVTALDRFGQAADLARASNDFAGLGNYLGNSANCHRHLGALEAALNGYQDAYEAHTRSRHINGMAHWRAAAATVLVVQDRPDDALRAFEEAARLHGRSGDVWGLQNDCRHVVGLALARGRHDLVQTWLATLERLPSLDAESTTDRHLLAGSSHLETGQSARAISEFSLAIEAAAGRPALEALGHMNLAVALRRAGSVERAMEHYRQALVCCEAKALPPENAWRLHHNYGILLEEDVGDVDAAATQYVLASRALEATDTGGLDWEAARRWVADHADVRRRLVDLLIRAGKLVEAIRTVDAGAAVYIDRWFRAMEPPPSAGSVQRREEFRESVQRIRQLELQLKFSRSEALGVFSPRTAAQEGLWRQLREERRRTADLRAALGQPPITAPTDLDTRDTSVVPVVLHQGRATLHLLAATSAPRHRSVALSDGELWRTYDAWRTSELSGRGDRAALLTGLLGILRRQLAEPLETLLTEASAKPDSMAVLVPQGGLNGLPVHVVLSGKPQRPVAYAPSVTLYDTLRRRPPVPIRRALIVQNPTGDLSHAAAECETVARSLRGVGISCVLLPGDQASAEALREGIAGADMLHFAGHAAFDLSDPLSSALIMAGRRRLTFRDLLSGVDVRHLQLAVLSACQTAIPDVRAGAESTGLATALLASGCRTVVGSLWRVGDKVTAFLMGALYAQLVGGASIAAGLASAVETVREYDPSPLSWAPFVTLGDGMLQLEPHRGSP